MDSPNRMTNMNTGSQFATPPLDWNDNRLSPQLHWKIATTTPNAAATESRLSAMAFAAMTSERNDTSSSRNANSSTNPNTRGTELLSAALKSYEFAVMPVTA